MQEEITILLPKMPNTLNGDIFTFTINKLKCRTGGLAVVYYKLYLWDLDNIEVPVNDDAWHIGHRMAIGETWSSYHDTFTIDEETLDRIKLMQIEIRFVLVDDNNPVYFSELMLQNGEFTEYHSTNEEMKEAVIGFNNSSYANLYDGDSRDYLQIIRGDKEPFTTKVLSKANITVLAPHLVGETSLDRPDNLFTEFINQKEQVTDIKMI